MPKCISEFWHEQVMSIACVKFSIHVICKSEVSLQECYGAYHSTEVSPKQGTHGHFLSKRWLREIAVLVFCVAMQE